MVQLMLSSPESRQSFQDIQSACFVLCLDSAQPSTLPELAEQVWFGQGISRWFDKGVQFVVNGNGRTGYVGEHSASDGGAGMRLNEYVQGFMREASSAAPEGIAELDGSKHVSALHFHVTNDLSSLIATARSQFQDTLANEEIIATSVQNIGEKMLSRQSRNANTCVQLIMNVAAYRMYGGLRPNYEPVSLVSFDDGRWTSCSMVIPEVLHFCQLISNSQSTQKARLDAFNAALRTHGKNVSTTADGVENTEAHLLALKEMVQEGEKMPELFADPVHQTSQQWSLSASSLPSKFNHHYGFWQVTEDGFGVGHMIRQDK
jgi:carnitine O-acetyltransferase